MKSAIAALFVLVLVTVFTSSVQASTVSTNFNDGAWSYATQMSKNDYTGGGMPQYYLYGYISTGIADIEDANLNWSRETSTVVGVYSYFDGLIGMPPVDMMNASQTMISNLNGNRVCQTVCTGYGTGTGDEKGSPMASSVAAGDSSGGYYAYGSCSLSFYSSDVINIAGTAQFSNTNWGAQPAFILTPDWYITFDSEDAANNFEQALSACGVMESADVPEPATMGLLGLGLTALVARRRNRPQHPRR